MSPLRPSTRPAVPLSSVHYTQLHPCNAKCTARKSAQLHDAHRRTLGIDMHETSACQPASQNPSCPHCDPAQDPPPRSRASDRLSCIHVMQNARPANQHNSMPPTAAPWESPSTKRQPAVRPVPVAYLRNLKVGSFAW